MFSKKCTEALVSNELQQQFDEVVLLLQELEEAIVAYRDLINKPRM